MKIEKIGYNVGTLLTFPQVISFSQLADKYNNTHSLWVPESWGREVFSTLGALSQVTKKTYLGSSIASIFSRTPATMAMGSVTVDYLSNKRFILGLGVSTPQIVENWHGKNYDQPLKRITEYIECIKEIMSGRKVTYTGNYYKVNNFKIGIPPPENKIPIYMAAINRKMLSLSSLISDGVILYMKPVSILKETVSIINNDLLQSKVDKSHNFEICCAFITSVSDIDPHATRIRVAKTLAFYIAVGKFYSQFLSTNGFKKEVDAILEHYNKNGLPGLEQHISEKMLDELTISGTRKEAREKVCNIIDTGITLPIIQINPLDRSETSIKEILLSFSES